MIFNRDKLTKARRLPTIPINRYNLVICYSRFNLFKIIVIDVSSVDVHLVPYPWIGLQSLTESFRKNSYI